MSVILVTAAILTVQSPSSSMLQPSYAQSCPDGSIPDASGNCPTLPTTPADDEETAEAPPPAGDEETAQAPPPATETPPPPATVPPATETPPPATEAPPATTETPPPATVPPAGASQVSNNTGNATGVDANSILAVFNRERAAAGLPLYVWNDTLAAHAQAWVDYMAAGKAGGRVDHCENIPGYQQIEECSYVGKEGETLAWTGPGYDPAAMIELTWMAEKPTRHYLAIVATEYKSIGCGYATSTNIISGEGTPMPFVVSILGCRYQ
jgi:uncharacterized protein YkwD